MSSVAKEYLVVLLYFVLLIGEGVFEAAWLRRKGWASWPLALTFSWLTNLVGWCIGFFVFFVTVGVTLALAWDGSMQRLPFKGNEAGVVLVLVVLFLPALLLLLKRVLLGLMRIPPVDTEFAEKRRWLVSLVASLVFWLAPLGVTILLTKLFFRFL
ncbi:MAG TPA: hypothetical protein VGN86_08570 [Pyrinomonadaceae bacterium]|jgi:hypothetical protein|nr:hypothetical protein [Pyrinomonadaceae bacterium]